MEVINTSLLSSLIESNINYAKLTNFLKEINESCHLEFKHMKPEAILATAKKINFR
jgi:hypothetical protein